MIKFRKSIRCWPRRRLFNFAANLPVLEYCTKILLIINVIYLSLVLFIIILLINPIKKFVIYFLTLVFTEFLTAPNPNTINIPVPDNDDGWSYLEVESGFCDNINATPVVASDDKRNGEEIWALIGIILN